MPWSVVLESNRQVTWRCCLIRLEYARYGRASLSSRSLPLCPCLAGCMPVSPEGRPIRCYSALSRCSSKPSERRQVFDSSRQWRVRWGETFADPLIGPSVAAMVRAQATVASGPPCRFLEISTSLAFLSDIFCSSLTCFKTLADPRWISLSRRQAAVLVGLAFVGRLVGVDAIALGQDRDALHRPQALARRRELPLDASAAASCLGEGVDMSVFAGVINMTVYLSLGWREMESESSGGDSLCLWGIPGEDVRLLGFQGCPAMMPILY